MNTQDFLAGYTRRFEESKAEEMSLDDYLELCRTDPTAYANPAQRLLMAIGEPEMVDTRHDPVLSRIFSNKIITQVRYICHNIIKNLIINLIINLILN